MLAMWTQAIVSIWSDDGHVHSSNHTEAAASDVGGEARDCRRDIGGGASVGLIARAHGVNANVVFNWRRLYQAGQLSRSGGRAKLSPVKVNCRKIGGDLVRIIPTILAGQDSHSTAACASEHRRKRRSGDAAGAVGVSAAMIAPPGNTQIWIAAGVTDLRRGFTGLSALVQTNLEQIPSMASTFKEEIKAQPLPISITLWVGRTVSC
jgi:transposase-like protein